MKTNFLAKSIIFFILMSCTSPVTPEFDIKDGLISVDSFLSNFPGSSYTKIYKLNEFNIGLNQYVNTPVTGAEVFLINSDTGEAVQMTEDNEVYLPPNDFVGSVGDTWQLSIKMEDGIEYHSSPETMADLVELSDINAEYKTEIEYNKAVGRFVPGHSIQAIFDDPLEKGNFYYWGYRIFQKKDICQVCSIANYFRNNACIPYTDDPSTPGLRPYFTYSCQSACWEIDYNTGINIFADDFINGDTIKMPVANILLENKRNFLIEIQQYSISASAYKYYEILKKITEESGGLNSPPPAALIGNMFNPNDDNEYVLGRFTAAAASEKRLMVKLSGIKETQLIPGYAIIEETNPISENRRVYTAPCGPETRYSTNLEPDGWE
ncbi:DUF4249 domain-containing protein [Arcticibacterium luteifluviistationis]|uniref:DUF4249 domain-containing protein n=1 Tax=Arcticibacterium luteifluviistationis TaxID=1784714 RepID=A0A2Z4G8T3_9BACT|nr:DUF4249 domain-containing protein [Arcticibacterium luteifluviistationis]AWV97649.1 hypothetical protein DJ013_05510 [Arcticibacterium luteifluviistationis]